MEAYRNALFQTVSAELRTVCLVFCRVHGLALREHHRALQRAGLCTAGTAARRSYRHRGQVPGPGSASRDLFDGNLGADGGAAWHGVSLQPQPTQRRHLMRALRQRPCGKPGAVRARMPHASTDAAAQRFLPLPGAGRDDQPLVSV